MNEFRSASMKAVTRASCADDDGILALIFWLPFQTSSATHHHALLVVVVEGAFVDVRSLGDVCRRSLGGRCSWRVSDVAVSRGGGFGEGVSAGY
jgi:hypothetical protein